MHFYFNFRLRFELETNGFELEKLIKDNETQLQFGVSQIKKIR